MERGAALFGKATFAMDRGYDDNKMFLKLDELEQDYVIRLTAKRKLFFHGKWVPATQLRNQRSKKMMKDQKDGVLIVLFCMNNIFVMMQGIDCQKSVAN